MEWTITPLCMGTLEVNKSIEMAHTGYGETMHVPCIAWLLRSGNETVLVDTGPASPEWSAKHHRPMQRSDKQYLVPALKAEGLLPHEIKHVIITHLHWDHVWGCTEVPQAKIYIQREEMRYAAAPYPGDSAPYESNLGFLLMARFYDRIEPVDGDQSLLPGIRLLSTPGHTPGSQSVAVETAEGLQIIVGDLVGLYAALATRPPHLPGIFHSMDACYASFRKVLALSDKVLPGHDPEVFKRFASSTPLSAS